MPSTSPEQAKLMAAVAHGWKPKGAKKPPVPVAVAKEFHSADKALKENEIHKPGTKVRVAHKGKMVDGKVVRHEPNPGDGGSPFYVVDVGEYESKKVPVHQLKENEMAQIDQAAKVAPKKTIRSLRAKTPAQPELHAPRGATLPESIEVGKKFITDLGHTHLADIKSERGESIHVPRYAVWAHDNRKGKHQVLETHDDLEYLIKKHGINDKHIVKLQKEEIEERRELVTELSFRRKEKKEERKSDWDGNDRRKGPRRKLGKVNAWGDRRASTHIHEDAAVNSAGAGAVAAIGTTKAGNPTNFAEPSPKNPPMLRRKRFMGQTVFPIKTEQFMKLREGKRHYARYEEYVGNDEMGQAIREWGNRNYGKAIIVEDENTGMMCFLRYGGKIPR